MRPFYSGLWKGVLRLLGSAFRVANLRGLIRVVSPNHQRNEETGMNRIYQGRVVASERADQIRDRPVVSAGAGSCHEMTNPTSRALAGFSLRNAFVTGVSAWRIGNQFALSNFVLIPLGQIAISAVNAKNNLSLPMARKGG